MQIWSCNNLLCGLIDNKVHFDFNCMASHQGHWKTFGSMNSNASFQTTLPAQLATTWFGSRHVVFPSREVCLQRGWVVMAGMRETTVMYLSMRHINRQGNTQERLHLWHGPRRVLAR